MNFIDDLITFTRKYLCKINFGKGYLYIKKEMIDSLEVDYKDLEKRLVITGISLNNIVDGRLTISIPGNIANKVSEVMIISE